MATEIVITFTSTNHAVKAEGLLLEAKVPVGVMPLPGVIHAGCGLCLRFGEENFAKVLALLQGAQVPVEGVYTRRLVNGKSEYKLYKTKTIL